MHFVVGGCRGWGWISPARSLTGDVPMHESYGVLSTSFLVETDRGGFIVVDGGSGVTNLGAYLASHSRWKEGGKTIDCLLTHGHQDHTIGFPAFKPLFQGANAVHFYAPCLNEADLALSTTSPGSVARRMVNWDREDLPFELSRLPSVGQFSDFVPGERVSVATPHAEVSSFPIYHPGGAVAYSIRDGATGDGLVIATDYECDFGFRDKNFVRWLRQQQPRALVMDGQYLRQTHADRDELLRAYPNVFVPGWGHSDPYDCVDLAAEAEVSRLLITHHDARLSDYKLIHLDGLVRKYAHGRGVEASFLKESDNLSV